MNNFVGFIVGNLFLALIACAGAGSFFILYSAVQWLSLSDVPHGILGGAAVIASVFAAAGTGWSIDRHFNR